MAFSSHAAISIYLPTDLLLSLLKILSLTRTSLTQARRASMLLQSRFGTCRHPQDTPLISRKLSREIGSRDIVNPACTFSCSSNSHATYNPEPDSQRSTTRDIATRAVNALNFQTPSTEVSIPDVNATWTPLALGTHTTTSPQDFADRESMIQVTLRLKTPSVKPRDAGISCHLSLR
jgi:hypothetical protein